MLGGLVAGAGLAVAARPSGASLLTVARRPAETFVLGNGLQVVVLPSRRAPIVTQMVIYKVGSADEVVGRTGIAHFLEHMMFKGTNTLGSRGILAHRRAQRRPRGTPSPTSTSPATTRRSPPPTGSSW